MHSTTGSAPASVGLDAGQRGERLFLTLLGYGLMWVALFLAWLLAAGVQPEPTASYPSVPSVGSIAVLLGVTLILGAGAGLVACYGSQYGTTSPATVGESGRADPTSVWNVRSSAVFLVVFGSGLLLLGLSLPVSMLGLGHGLLPIYISPRAEIVPETVDAVAVASLTGGIALFAVGRRRHPTEFRSWWRRVGRYATVAGTVVVVIFAALLLVPIPQSSSLALSLPGGGTNLNFQEFPPGAVVTVTWATVPAAPVNLTVQGAPGTIFSANASSGTFSFHATGVPEPLYSFWITPSVSGTVFLNASYRAPLWSWPPGEPGSPT